MMVDDVRSLERERESWRSEKRKRVVGTYWQ